MKDMHQIQKHRTESDFLLLQQGVVTDFGCLIFVRRLRSFYFIKLYFKSEPSDLYLTAEIQNRVKLRAKSMAGNPYPHRTCKPERKIGPIQCAQLQALAGEEIYRMS
jgi:hypothetical protein